MKRSEEIRNAATEYAYDRDRIDAFRDGAEWADEHPGWISMKDEKPKLGEYVLLYAEGWSASCIGALEMWGDKVNYYDDYGTLIDDEISYWMSLPCNPQEGGSNED